MSRSKRASRRALITALAVAAAVEAGIAGERYLLRKARSVPDPSRDEPLAERPGIERRIRSFDGTELAVCEVGPTEPTDPTRPTLVFAHGFSLDLTTWHYQWREFSRGSRCVLYDHRGHGRSGLGNARDYSIDALGRDLLAVLDATCPDGPVVLIGHSMGGMAILSLAAHHPEEFGGRVSGVVLANTAAGELLKEALGSLGVRGATFVRQGLARLGSQPERVDRIRDMAGGRGAGIAFLIARATNFGPDVPASLVDHVTRVSAATPAEVWTDLFANVLELDLWHALDRVRVPALVLAGAVDRLTPASSSIAVAKGLPDARLVIVPGAGHCTMLEQPGRFDRELEAFLKELASREPAGEAARAPA